MATRAGEGASPVGTEGQPCGGGGRGRRGAEAPLDSVAASPAWDTGRGVSRSGRVEPGTSGLPGGAGPRARLTQLPARGSAPPGRPGTRRGVESSGGGAARGAGRGRAGAPRGGRPGRAGSGAGARRGRRGGRGRSRGPGKARPVAQLGPVGSRGGRGRRAVVPRTFPLLSEAGCGPAGDVMGSPSPAPRRGRVGGGEGRGGHPKGVSSATRGGKGKVIVKLETH